MKRRLLSTISKWNLFFYVRIQIYLPYVDASRTMSISLVNNLKWTLLIKYKL
jgi:hypothetical protein